MIVSSFVLRAPRERASERGGRGRGGGQRAKTREVGVPTASAPARQPACARPGVLLCRPLIPWPPRGVKPGADKSLLGRICLARARGETLFDRARALSGRHSLDEPRRVGERAWGGVGRLRPRALASAKPPQRAHAGCLPVLRTTHATAAQAPAIGCCRPRRVRPRAAAHVRRARADSPVRATHRTAARRTASARAGLGTCVAADAIYDICYSRSRSRAG